jgi:hypothetical protein
MPLVDDNPYYTPHPDYTAYYLVAFLCWILFSFAVANLAKNKGNSALSAFFVSLHFSPFVAFILVLASKPNEANIEVQKLASGKNQKCPYCAEIIKAEATCCRFCGKELMLVKQFYQGKKS